MFNLAIWASRFSGMEWWTGTVEWIGMVEWTGMVEWNGMVTGWMVLLNFHLLIMTTSEQRPPFNKDHPTFD